MTNYRIFISYSHEDQKIVEKVVSLLQKFDLTPMWDRTFVYGYGFHEQIKSFIAHAHVFMPVITESAMKRGWVHQEIGYAMALNVPVLPISVGTLPGEMIQQLHAIKTDKHLVQLKQYLSRHVFENLVRRFQDPRFPLYQSAELTEDRAILLARYSKDIIEMGHFGCVRQKGALSSFHIPDKPISDPVWTRRYGKVKKSQFHCRLQREERLALEQHARQSGCKLIICPYLSYEIYGAEARKIRLQTLLEFLESISDDLVQVAINQKEDEAENLIIVGDWFTAESVSGAIGIGYRQTIFTRHAPTMQSRIELFDQEFDLLLNKAGWSPQNSRIRAIETLKEIIDSIEKD